MKTILISLFLTLVTGGCASSLKVWDAKGNVVTLDSAVVIAERPPLGSLHSQLSVQETTRVLVVIVIGKDGKVAKVVDSMSVPEGLDSVASNLTRRFEFTRPTSNGTPVDISANMLFTFSPSRSSGNESDEFQIRDSLFFGLESVIAEPEIIRKVAPEYPSLALRDGLEGAVVVKLSVDSNGIVTDAEILKSSNPIFNETSLAAARQFVLKPPMFFGKPIRVKLSFPFRFKLKDRRISLEK